MKKVAFSLSELLLAVGIVAVISTLMITTVIPKGDEKKYSTLANKAYLTLEEAYDVQIMNDGGLDASNYGAEEVLFRMVQGETPALPTYARNGNVAQLPNGMIINNTGANLFVDIDGIEGKTRSTLNSPPRRCGESDILLFVIDGSDISPDYDCGFAREYFEYNDRIN
ncbi:hypothetical protein IJC60_04285 [bacterium]|nr:hypothetical protein [bacterium]